MQSVRVDIISIGTLARNRLWNESEPVRTAHATTSLIRAGKHNILIDPGLPAPALSARLQERTGLRPDAVNIIFLTTFRQSHRMGLGAFPNAKVLLHEHEQQVARELLEELEDRADADDAQRIREELHWIDDVQSPPDQLAEGVDLFPLFGVTPGTCGLLVTTTTTSTLVTGPAVPTLDHFLAGQVLPDAQDIKAATESMAEAYEIADLIVPGYDNIFLNPRAQGL